MNITVKRKPLFMPQHTWEILIEAAEMATAARSGVPFFWGPWGCGVPSSVDGKWLTSYIRTLHKELKRRWQQAERPYQAIMADLYAENHPILEFDATGFQPECLGAYWPVKPTSPHQ